MNQTVDHQEHHRLQGEPWRDDSQRPFVEIRGLSKHFGDVTAVEGADLDIYRGELFSILGGSGSGKSTLLRMLAGFEVPTSGSILIDGVDMTAVPPYERPVNMMFQSYALFPHMTVEQNIAYGLKKEKVAKQEISERVADLLALVKLDGKARRKPDQLSGGERQRVALARALIKRPKLLLLDEPLAALDKKLREHTQFELMALQDELGITFIVVTHDQEEAMTLSTRIAVMNNGHFEQVGTPAEVYEYPVNRFVADFVGNINFFKARVTAIKEDRVSLHSEDLGPHLEVPCNREVAVGDELWIAVRPEKIFISKEAPQRENLTVLKGFVHDLGYFGNLSVYRVALENGTILQVSGQNRQRSAVKTLEWDDDVFVSWDIASAILLDQ
ncbi:MAG TPA: ABC transporter ATP-binding protein [Xanthomonadales bacterium]|nr:ABC transporter ATP-binding protein [Xanthomonadales bacterium]